MRPHSLSTVPIGTLAPMHPAIAQHRASIAAICQRYGIRRLEVFGSAARGDDFVAETSGEIGVRSKFISKLCLYI